MKVVDFATRAGDPGLTMQDQGWVVAPRSRGVQAVFLDS